MKVREVSGQMLLYFKMGGLYMYRICPRRVLSIVLGFPRATDMERWT